MLHERHWMFMHIVSNALITRVLNYCKRKLNKWKKYRWNSTSKRAALETIVRNKFLAEVFQTMSIKLKSIWDRSFFFFRDCTRLRIGESSFTYFSQRKFPSQEIKAPGYDVPAGPPLRVNNFLAFRFFSSTASNLFISLPWDVQDRWMIRFPHNLIQPHASRWYTCLWHSVAFPVHSF